MPSRDDVKKHLPKIVTITLVVVALLAAWLLYRRYAARPWTRDGQVRADVVKIAPRVSGYLKKIAVTDNQPVKEGDLLFQIDPEPYELAVQQAQVNLDQAREDVAALAAELRAAEATVAQRQAAITSAESQIKEAEAGLASADAAVKEAESGVASARAQIAQVAAQLKEAKTEAERARRLADKKAGSVEAAESKEAAYEATRAQLDGANAGLKQSEAALDKAKAAQNEAQAKLDTARNGLAEAEAAEATAIADRDKAQANLGQTGEANVKIRNAQVQLEQAELNLEWTSIYAPADGYITNMNLLEDTFVSPGTPFALFVDASSFRVDAYFQETKLKSINEDDPVIITVMGHRSQPLKGKVDSIGYAINPPNLAATDGPENLVPTIEPTFEWIRLAQRVPVRIRLTEIPKDLHLVSGMTASVSIEK